MVESNLREKRDRPDRRLRRRKGPHPSKQNSQATIRPRRPWFRKPCRVGISLDVEVAHGVSPDQKLPENPQQHNQGATKASRNDGSNHARSSSQAREQLPATSEGAIPSRGLSAVR